MAIKLLIGGSPCTHWSIAQKNNRETEPSGIGWELFKNYLIAKEKFKPDLFLYENNKSAAQPIKDQIAHELGVGYDPMARFTYINSALVSAQNRQRFYVTNFGDIEQPEDRGILLKNILENGSGFGESNDKSYALCATYYKGQAPEKVLKYHERTHVAESVCVAQRGRYDHGEIVQHFEAREDGKNNTLTTVQKDNMVAEPMGFSMTGTFRNRNASVSNKAYCLAANPSSDMSGRYIEPVSTVEEANNTPIYLVENGVIKIKDKSYPIKLPDGFYIIRKLTITECCRLQTMPDDYCKAVSATQGYKGLGNGWTAEVIIHLLNHALKDIPRNEEIVVLSLYDGIGTGRYCLDKMGFTNVTYHAYEIDKYPIQIAMDNYPDIIQHGDTFAVREDSWKPPQTRSEWLDCYFVEGGQG